jgi:hypothetical protein
MRRRLAFVFVLVLAASLLPMVGAADHVTKGDLRAAFNADAAGAHVWFDLGVQRPTPAVTAGFDPHGRVLPFTNEDDPDLFCKGDPVGSWVSWRASWDPRENGARNETVEFLDSIVETYALDVYGDGGPVPLPVERTHVRGWSPTDSHEKQVWFSQGVPVIDSDLLPLGRHVLLWTADGVFNGSPVPVPIFVAQCPQTGKLYADAENVTVEVSDLNPSGFINKIWLVQPYVQFIGDDGSGVQIDLLGVGAGTELVFEIAVFACPDPSCDTGTRYQSGPPSNNPDGLQHALLVEDGPKTWVFFEDIDGASWEAPHEPNYIDAIFTVEPATP